MLTTIPMVSKIQVGDLKCIFSLCFVFKKSTKSQIIIRLYSNKETPMVVIIYSTVFLSQLPWGSENHLFC